jgi:hypothetical protein
MKATLPNLKTLPYGGASAVEDPAMLIDVATMLKTAPVDTWLTDVDIHNRFVDQYRSWITSSKLNNLKGLDLFPVMAASLGTTESFDKFYLKNRTRRFRCFRGEYMYHAASWRNYFPDWRWIEDEPIAENDAVVISVPFSDTGDIHSRMTEVLIECTRLGVPVLADAAFYGTCGGVTFDFDHDCITDITFSLSKTFPVSHVRVGMRLTREDDDDSLLVHHKTKYINRLGCGLGLELIRRWGPDHNYKTWRKTQELLCTQLGITPSPSVLFGIDTTGKYSQYNRGGTTSRLCLARYLANGTLPND